MKEREVRYEVATEQ
jgi:tRNA/tmRNA/rRNA uracil-C5-methylase (TrmA/RlmC/RlmD family)